MEGLGAHRLWGASPALDLLRARDELLAEGGAPDELRVLVIGSGDLRHALRTIAALRRKGRRERKVKLFLYDTPLECVARHLLLLAVLTDWTVPIRVRANTFLEVFGNALVQERTAHYIARLGQELVSFVCDGKGPLRRLVDLSHLKVRTSPPCTPPSWLAFFALPCAALLLSFSRLCLTALPLRVAPHRAQPPLALASSKTQTASRRSLRRGPTRSRSTCARCASSACAP
jgi:hypothetical protein